MQCANAKYVNANSWTNLDLVKQILRKAKRKEKEEGREVAISLAEIRWKCRKGRQSAAASIK